ncbi:SDR family oxidoreductase [Roseinatronobacter bogoriensis]|uniref:NAD(P)-dependent oxidoreductase n=1 Tax=Roseinatronobacter bogoriensis subsp. barguzinensis TaxID=441209 RepID=A0A2K8KAJ0_9RHOB|nr:MULTISPECIES: SDR family oxidoreductase [Rhodobaca]ATX66457.1 NAD(P)-dependent oxidoreductase [Rhodobaca barguzinensis]MBB4207604.1 NADP-dependent 3-hydroxy acid dehydrogenase YdfG [Rhodobaca bogoriensis DSM 18756]TDW40089.1 NADP-dependent 3-hydroxy acid dehydrogenase YdfG [Rhodobaca barguzinensis]TDY70758.1 NADP-dependent 3-hydroxy acid dehydrogenase YdfG [Rhodobaca bogoriensis DSM 18756]
MTREKTVFITGASSGIGAATAKAAVAAGWNVGLMARSADKLDSLVQELGEASLAVAGDATDLGAQESAIARVASHFGGIDAAFANAGMGVDTPGTEAGDPREWRRMIDLNIMALLYTARVALPELRKTKGQLVLTGSVAGKLHILGSIYGATKWFVHGYAGNMAQEMREWGGRCTLIAPGMVDTPFFSEPKPDKLQPEDIANAVIFALSQPERASISEITVMPTG